MKQQEADTNCKCIIIRRGELEELETEVISFGITNFRSDTL